MTELKDVQKRITTAFRLFDSTKSDVVDVREIGTVIRSLGFNPTELQVKEMIDKLEDDANPGFISLAAFLPAMVASIEDEAFPRDSFETIAQAFQVFDPDGKGFIEMDDLKEAMTGQGERFSEEEIESMIRACADVTTGRIHYEEYARSLAENGPSS
jgi:Ca2+-binding EF-hand superfamily protein